MHEGVFHHLFAEGRKFSLSGKFAPNDEISDFEERTLLGQVFDGVTSVLEDALLAIDEADSGGTGDSVHVSGVIASEHLSFVGKFGKVVGLQKAIVGVELVGFSSARVCDGDSVLAGDLIGDEVQPLHKDINIIDVILPNHIYKTLPSPKL